MSEQPSIAFPISGITRLVILYADAAGSPGNYKFWGTKLAEQAMHEINHYGQTGEQWAYLKAIQQALQPYKQDRAAFADAAMEGLGKLNSVCIGNATIIETQRGK